MNDRPPLDEIRARCALPVTQVVTNPREYLRLQTILRDRAELLRLLDECIKERDHYMALSAMNNVEALRGALTRALDLLRIGMDAGLEPHEKDEANKLLVLFGYGEAFTKSLHEIIGVDMAKGPDQTVTHLVRTPAARAEELLRQGLSTLANKASDYFEALEIAHRHLDMAALIDAALAGAAVPASESRHTCRSCGAFVDSRGKCRIPEHNA